MTKIKIRARFILYNILIMILIDVAIAVLFFKSRSFSHLAVWKIIESSKTEDFYWQPEDTPEYFYFEPDSDNLSTFRTEIAPVIKVRDDEFEKVLRVARYVMDISSVKIQPRLSLKWDSPEEILRQIRKGAGANCFHRCILFSTYLYSIGVKARLWALENENFDAISHTVTEVYIKDLKKWIFIDVMSGFYVTEYGKPLSFLELREKLLSGGAETILVHNIDGSIRKMPFFYSRLTKCVFLRADNDFVNKYDYRYGVFPVFQRCIDKLPDDMRRGLDYLLGRRDVFIHYVDRFSRSLKPKIITAKLFFYFFIFSLVFMGILLAILSLSFLKHYLPVNLSKKDTLHSSSKILS